MDRVIKNKYKKRRKIKSRWGGNGKSMADIIYLG
jgi:hypothetical protein